MQHHNCNLVTIAFCHLQLDNSPDSPCRAHDLALSQPVVVPSTKFGLLENVLSHLASGMSAKRDLAVGMARGLAYTLSPEHRKEYLDQLVR
jgi:hypothetical protein